MVVVAPATGPSSAEVLLKGDAPMTDKRHLLGLLLGTEEDWPAAFESIVRLMGPVIDQAGDVHAYDVERVTIEPFDLRDTPRYDLVIDRLAYWYYHPREWLKKAALTNDLYLLNSPFTFQSMEKHAAYCAMIRLGLRIPQTVLVPYKNPPENAKYAYTAAQYNQPFNLDEIAERIGYPLFMKPYDGGAWVGVSSIRNQAELHDAYDSSGQRLMHLQQAVTDYDVFARSLSIGAETMVMHFCPDEPMHARYVVDYDFLDAPTGDEVITISRLVNAFFRWEFNSCETLVKNGGVYPIDYANACPDVAITSLHYYFPWAMKALVKWSVFCTVTGRRPRYDLETRRYFDIADQPELAYGERLRAYRALADEYFEVPQYEEFCANRLRNLDAVVFDWVDGPDFDRLLIDTVRAMFPPHEHDRFIAHYRGLLQLWANDERARLG
jgi:D-ala D-ala ligase C-terminus